MTERDKFRIETYLLAYFDSVAESTERRISIYLFTSTHVCRGIATFFIERIDIDKRLLSRFVTEAVLVNTLCFLMINIKE